jgi:hypothetical protein
MSRKIEHSAMRSVSRRVLLSHDQKVRTIKISSHIRKTGLRKIISRITMKSQSVPISRCSCSTSDHRAHLLSYSLIGCDSMLEVPVAVRLAWARAAAMCASVGRVCMRTRLVGSVPPRVFLFLSRDLVFGYLEFPTLVGDFFWVFDFGIRYSLSIV